MSTIPEFVPITSIKVRPDRQRKEFDEVGLLDLANSITERELLHAIVLDPEGFLVAGERRLRALSTHVAPLGKTFRYNGEVIRAGFVPVIRTHSTDPLHLMELEWAENMHRKALTWQEQAEAHAKLHTMRAAQKERQAETLRVATGEPVPAPQQTVAQTAEEVFGRSDGAYHTTIREELIVAKHFDKPEVAKAASLKEAIKVIKKIEDAERNRALAAAIGANFSAEDHTLLNGDCIGKMQVLIAQERRFDVILTDPPYGMGAHEFGDAAGRLTQIDHQYDDSYESWKALMGLWCPLAFIITKPMAHAYVFCDIDRFHELKAMMEQAGWFVLRTPLTNYKRNSGRVPHPDFGPRRQSEWLLYAVKGKKPHNYIGSDVIVTDSDENLTHGAQKPVALYEELLRRSVKPGDEVLDTFAGTGTLLPAAHGLKCKATVIEQSPTYFGLCVQRAQALASQPEPPL